MGEMNFKEAVEYLGISEYEDRIYNSNSMGELFHIYEYIGLANNLKNDSADDSEFLKIFKKLFVAIVKQAEKDWDRPESIFQHILRNIFDILKNK